MLYDMLYTTNGSVKCFIVRKSHLLKRLTRHLETFGTKGNLEKQHNKFLHDVIANH